MTFPGVTASELLPASMAGLVFSSACVFTMPTVVEIVESWGSTGASEVPIRLPFASGCPSGAGTSPVPVLTPIKLLLAINAVMPAPWLRSADLLDAELLSATIELFRVIVLV